MLLYAFLCYKIRFYCIIMHNYSMLCYNMIYWVYNDNVNSPLMQAWLEKHSPVDLEDLERHDKWLCMMWPRLHLLYELLSDDGIIFISIFRMHSERFALLRDFIFCREFDKRTGCLWVFCLGFLIGCFCGFLQARDLTDLFSFHGFP